MPNIGTRGMMWQEIEGKKRNTPSRMFLPLFYESDLKALLIRLAGEFRWEMCKRIQGMRWNDLTDPSLTSEFCDYLQFYNTNGTLTGEDKENIRNELLKERNNYKRVFVSYYVKWLLYESNGMPRLNKNVRAMLMTYCPFPAAIREKLLTHPQYSVILNKYNFMQKKRVQHVSRVIQKIRQSGKQAPQELLDELEFANR